MLSPTRTRRNLIVVDVPQEVLTEPGRLSIADGPNQGRTGTMPNVKGGKGTAVHIFMIIAATGLLLHARRNVIVVDVLQEVLTEPGRLSIADGPNQGRTGTMPNVKGGKGTAVHIFMIIAATGLLLHALASTSTMRRTSWMRTSNTRTSRISSRARTSRTKNFMTRTSRKTSTNSSLNSLLCFKRYALGVDLPVFYLYHVAMMCC